MNQREPLLHGSRIGESTSSVTLGLGYDMKKLATSMQSQEVPASDLPSWTPLRTEPEEEDLLVTDWKVDEVAARKETGLAMIPLTASLRTPTNTQTTAQTTVTGKALPVKPSPDAWPPKAKKARFVGVIISTKPPSYQRFSTQSRHAPAQAASNVPAFSLVDALARTFDANRHPEGPLPSPSRVALRLPDDTSTGLQTDVETTTEAEDEHLQLNTRLARTPLNLKRPRDGRGVIALSANAAEEAISLAQPERLTKRLKAIPYEANTTLIDGALGTVRAPISWEAELDTIARNDDVVTCARMSRVGPTVGAGRIDDDDDAAAIGTVAVGSPAVTANPWRTSTRTGAALQQPALSPYLSRGAQFRHRLDAAFGDNTTVRTDRAARPRPVEYELLAAPDGVEREPSVSASESTDSSTSTEPEMGMEEARGASAAPSTHVTTQSPDDVSPPPGATRPALGTGEPEERMHGWIAALQRLVKGKVRINEEELEALSIILAEIDSVRDNLDQRSPMTSELRESVRQLSKLYEIPFGDRNKLRQRADNISRAWPSVGRLGAS